MYFLLVGFGFLILFVFSKLSEKLAKKFYSKTEGQKRISETKYYKTITRRGEEFEYELPLKPNYKGFWIRVFSKLIDYGLYYGITLLFLDEIPVPHIISSIYIFPFLAVFTINPILETLFGTTLGKFIFRLEVIDDFGNKPSFLISFLRNLLLFNFIIAYIFTRGRIIFEEDEFFHNQKTLTYTIKSKEKKGILELLSKSV